MAALTSATAAAICVGRGRIGAQMSLGHPDAADVHAVRAQADPDARGAEHEFGRATADVRNQQRPGHCGQAEPTAPAKDRAASSDAGDHLGIDPELAAHHREKVVPVRGVAGCAGGDHPHPFGVVGGDRRRVVGQRHASALERLGGQPAGAVDALAQPDDPHLAHHVDQPVIGRVGDQQPDRVGPAVDPGNSHRGTHGPPAHQSGSWASASSPSGLTPGPTASECATNTCRHLTRVGIPPALIASDLLHPGELVTAGQVRHRAPPGTARPAPRRRAAVRSSRASGRTASSVPIADAARGQVK